MHGGYRDSYALDETATAYDLEQTPADLVALSFSDSDLGAFAAGWHRANGTLPSLRLANLVALRHPMSVDTYIDATLADAKGILIRLIGGESYWSYGLSQVRDLAQRRGIALAVLPGDGREDTQLDAFSTLPVSTLRRLSALCDAGGALAAQAALAQLALAAGLYAGPVQGEKIVPDHGWYDPARGVVAEPTPTDRPLVVVTFYRSYLTAADTEPVDTLIGAFRSRGYDAIGLFVPSLKAPGATEWTRDALRRVTPAAVVNATAFSARGDDGTSPLDVSGCPVFQVALSTARKRDWAASDRGLSSADLAMHVVLPELDGRIFAGVTSFKSPGKRDPDLQYSRFAHRADGARIEAVADRVTSWHRLATTPAPLRKLALVLSTYPGRADQMAHAVGLDALASTEAILSDLTKGGYTIADGPPLAAELSSRTLVWPTQEYRAALASLPQSLQDALSAAWGEPEADPAIRDGAFHFAALLRGNTLIALQPERGEVTSRDAEYHDLARTPRHGYVAFYLWLRVQQIHALVHIGAHGTLEWLPGKSVALSESCWPEALT
ncbi:MAG: cobaltochelatase subunit CobN, partial [Xanthobacteraceae bacterium]|nr:cobaltochelatase subunit CobN [Xanthobacteraceae bacterium]